MITKYQEKTFKDYLELIEELNRDIAIEIETSAEKYRDLKEIRIKFFNFFKRQLK